MSPGIVVAVIMGGFALVGTVMQGWYAWRSARNTAQSTRDIEEQKLSVSTWVAQVDAWRKDVVTLREQRAEDRREHEAHRQECARLVAELTDRVTAVANEKDDLQSEVTWLRNDRADQIRRDRVHTSWNQEIVRWVNKWLPQARATGLHIPDPPKAPDLPPLIDPERLERPY